MEFQKELHKLDLQRLEAARVLYDEADAALEINKDTALESELQESARLAEAFVHGDLVVTFGGES